MKNLISTIILGVFFAMNIISGQETFTLDEAIQYGIENQNSVKVQDLNIENAEAEIKEVKSIGMPKVSGKVDYSYYYYTPQQPVQDFISPTVYSILDAEGLPTTTQGPPATFNIGFVQPHQFTAGVSANMLVFDGSYIYGLRAAKLYRELAKKQKDNEVVSVTNNITKAYLSILIAEENKAYIVDNITTVEKSLREVSAMYEEGFMESLDVDRTQLTYDNLTTQLENLNGIIELSYNLLKFQMNYPLDQEIQLGESIDDLIVKFEAQTITEESIDPSNREEYKLLNLNQELNQLNLKRYKAGYLPNVAAFTSYQESLQRANLFDGNEAGFLPTGVVGLNINVPIYDGGEKSAQIQKVKIDIQETDIQKQEFERAMTLEVMNARTNLQNARRSVANTEKNLQTTQSIYDRTQIKFREGVGSSVEVTQAEGSLFQAQSAYTSALYDLLEAKVNLEIALGKL